MRKVSISILFQPVSLTWGTTWLTMRIAAETIPPVFATGVRFMFATPLFNHHCMVKEKAAFVSSCTTFIPVYNLYFLLSIPFSLMIYGETYVSSGLAATLFANMPVAVLIASVLFLNEKN